MASACCTNYGEAGASSPHTHVKYIMIPSDVQNAALWEARLLSYGIQGLTICLRSHKDPILLVGTRSANMLQILC